VNGILEIALLLMAAHCLCDYPLQGDFMAQGKNRNTAIGRDIWLMILPSHAAIHAGAVLVVTGSAAACIIEFVTHTLIDFLKCEGKITFAQDQAAHLLVKALIVTLMAASLI